MALPPLLVVTLACLVATTLPLGVGATLEELWRVPIGLGASSVTGEPLTASTSDAYFAADVRGSIFAFSTDGQLLWSSPGNSTLAALITAPTVDDVLLVGYVVGAARQGAVIQALDARTGMQLWNRTFSLISSNPQYVADGYRGTFVFAVFNANANTYDITGYGLHRGDVRWTQTVSGSIDRMFVSESVVVLEGFFGNSMAALTLSPTSGALLCSFNTTATLFWYSLGGNVIFVQPTSGTYGLYDATTCALLTNLTDLGQTLELEPFTTPNHMLVFGTDSQNWFLAVFDQDGTQRWSVTLPVAVSFIAGIPTAGIDGETLYVGWGGVLASFDLRTGAMLWQSTQAVPVAPNPIPVIPMGHGRALVPNLQGYVLLDTNTQRVLDVNLHQPMTPPLWHRRQDNSTVVLIGELSTGDLVALYNRWDPLQTLWEVPLAISLEQPGRRAQDAANCYVADARGVIFAVEAASGRVLWSALGGNALTGLRTLPSYPDRVFAIFLTGIEALSVLDGTRIFNVSFLVNTSTLPLFVTGLYITNEAIIALTAPNPAAYAYSPRNGEQLYWYILYEESTLQATSELGVFYVPPQTDSRTVLQLFNLSSGSVRCELFVPYGSIAGAGGTQVIVSDLYGTFVLNDTCGVSFNLTAEFGNSYFATFASSLGVAVLHQAQNGTMALFLVGAWKTELPIPSAPPTNLFLTANPAEPGQLLFKVQASSSGTWYFGAVDATSGTLLWWSTLNGVDGAMFVTGLPVFQLDTSMVFVEMERGYSLLDTSSQTALRVETNPSPAVAYFAKDFRSGSPQQPMLLLVDLISGALKAVVLNR